MFGIFKKKNKKKKLDATVDTALGLLNIQIALGNADGSNNDKLIDQYGRGYMYGMCDALTQTANINSDKELADVLVFVHIKLFGDKDVREILDLTVEDEKRKEPMFLEGCKKGGKDVIEFCNNKTPTMGLANYLLDEKK